MPETQTAQLLRGMKQTRQHGTRAAYVFGTGATRGKGCRCPACREANRDYQRKRDRARRRPDETPEPATIDATEAREHLRWLRGEGLGLRTVSERTGIARTTLDELRSGRRTRCRPQTAEKILGVGVHKAADGCFVDATNTWQLIDEMLQAGHSKTSIARGLGSRAANPALQLGKRRVTQRKARQVENLHEILTLELWQRRERDRTAQQARRRRQKTGQEAGDASDGPPSASDRSPK